MRAIEVGEEWIPAHVVDRLADGEPPLKVWHEYRGFTLGVLAERTGVEEAKLARIESGAEPGSAELLAPLAEVLRVDEDDLTT